MKNIFRLAGSAFPQLSKVFRQINRILTKLHPLKLGSPVIMPHHVESYGAEIMICEVPQQH